MQSIILDTNVVVSALLAKNSPPSKIIDELVLNRKVEIFASYETLAECIEVLGREKFARFPDFKARAEILLNRLHEIAVKFSPEIRLDIIADEDDNRFLELVLVAQPDFLITGNTNDFTMTIVGRTQIVTPREYCVCIGRMMFEYSYFAPKLETIILVAYSFTPSFFKSSNKRVSLVSRASLRSCSMCNHHFCCFLFSVLVLDV